MLDTPHTALSGGQSRALMIADMAILSDSPIVLIDEIENAGIDKRLALEVLIRGQKIVIMATHDPILAQSGHYRLVLGNGALRQVLQTSAGELELLEELRSADQRLGDIRRGRESSWTVEIGAGESLFLALKSVCARVVTAWSIRFKVVVDGVRSPVAYPIHPNTGGLLPGGL